MKTCSIIGSYGKESPCSAGYTDLIPGSGRSPGEGNGNALQCSCLENPMTEEPCGLQSMGLQRVRHDERLIHQSTHSHVLTEQRVQWPYMTKICILYNLFRKVTKQANSSNNKSWGRICIFVSATLHYLKCPCFNKNMTHAKEQESIADKQLRRGGHRNWAS